MARASLLLVGCVGLDLWLAGAGIARGQTIIDWTAGGANDSYANISNWSGFNVPNTTTESARFNLAGSYDVTLSSGVTTNVSDLIVLTGDINFASNAAVFTTYNVDDDAIIDGGDFTLSDSGGSGDVALNVGDELQVRGGSTFRVQGGSSVRMEDLRLANNPGGNGTIIVEDKGSSLTQTGFAIINIGQAGDGTLTVQNGAVANFAAPVQLAVFAGAGKDGTLNVLGAAVSMPSLSVATGGANATASGRVSVNATDSLLTTTGAFAIGNNDASGPSALVDVGSSGVITAGGATTINDSGELRVLSSGVFNANGQLTMSSGSELRVDGGTLNVNAGLNNSAAGALDLRHGFINILGGAFVPPTGAFEIDSTALFASPKLTLANGLTTAFLGNLVLGDQGRGHIAVENGSVVTATNTSIGVFADAIGSATVSGAGSRLEQGALFVGFDGVGTVIVEQGGALFSGTADIGPNGALVVRDAGSSSTGTASIDIEGDLDVQSGGAVSSSSASIRSGGEVSVSGPETVWANSSILNVGNGSAGTLSITGGGRVESSAGILGNQAGGHGTATVTGSNGSGTPSTWVVDGILQIGAIGVGSLTVSSGGRVESEFAAIGTGIQGAALVTGDGSTWANANSLTVGSAAGAGALAVESLGHVEVGDELRIRAGGLLTIDGGSITTKTLRNSEGGQLEFLAGTLTITNGVGIGGDAFPTGLALGPHQHLVSPGTTIVAPQRTLRLEGGRLTTADLLVNGAFQFQSGTLELQGGGIAGIASLAVPGGGEFRAGGVQPLRIVGAAGSLITATDDLTLGDQDDNSGFYSNGALNVGANVVTLADANDVVFDSAAAVTLGSGGSAGTLAAANGLTLDFGGNIAGYGTIDTPNDPANPFINNGHVAGNSPSEQLTLTGYVKGVGTLDNVSITGTHAPGFSPATVFYGSVAYEGALEIELGGVSTGSFDKIVHTGSAELGGSLGVSLIAGFVPSPGNIFEIISAAGGIDGTFSIETLPTLSSHLDWEIDYGANAVTLAVVPALPGDFDFDGDVDGFDFLTWQRGESTNPLGAGDFADWRTNFGAQSLTASGPVPEPGALLLSLLGGSLGMFIARSGRTSS